MTDYILGDFNYGKAFIQPVGEDYQICIDKDGNRLFELSFDEKADKFISENVAIIHKTSVDKKALINDRGELLTYFDYDSIYYPEYYKDKCFIQVSIGGKDGIIDENGNEVLPCIYNDIRFSDLEEYGVILAALNNKCGLLDVNGKIVIPFDYEKLFLVDKNCVFVHHAEKGDAIIDFNNNEVIPFGEYRFKQPYTYIHKGDYFIVIDKDSKEHYLKPDGSFLEISEVNYKELAKHYSILEYYDSYEEAYNDLLIVKKGNYYGVTNKDLKDILTCIYDKIEVSVNEIKVQKSNKFGLFKINGENFIPVIYDELKYFEVEENGLEFTDITYIKALKNGKYGIIDRKNNIIIPFEYENIIYDIHNKGFKVFKNNEWSFISLAKG